MKHVSDLFTSLDNYTSAFILSRAIECLSQGAMALEALKHRKDITLPNWFSQVVNPFLDTESMIQNNLEEIQEKMDEEKVS